MHELTDVTGTCVDEGLFFVHSSELEDDEDVGVMGTELLPVNYCNKSLSGPALAWWNHTFESFFSLYHLTYQMIPLLCSRFLVFFSLSECLLSSWQGV